MNDMQSIWQNQPSELTQYVLNDIRRKARKLRAENRTATISWSALSVIYAAIGISIPHPYPRIGWIVLSFWTLYNGWRSYRSMRSSSADVSQSSLTFYRVEIRKRQEYFRRTMQGTGPLLGGAGLLLVVLGAGPMLIKAAPFLVLLTLWFIASVFGKKGSRSLAQELAELDRLESINSRKSETQ